MYGSAVARRAHCCARTTCLLPQPRGQSGGGARGYNNCARVVAAAAVDTFLPAAANPMATNPVATAPRHASTVYTHGAALNSAHHHANKIGRQVSARCPRAQPGTVETVARIGLSRRRRRRVFHSVRTVVPVVRVRSATV